MDKNNYLDDCLATLQIPSLPKKTWDKVSEFNKGICLVRRIDGTETMQFVGTIKRRTKLSKSLKISAWRHLQKFLNAIQFPTLWKLTLKAWTWTKLTRWQWKNCWKNVKKLSWKMSKLRRRNCRSGYTHSSVTGKKLLHSLKVKE